jgi:hypothetical protein
LRKAGAGGFGPRISDPKPLGRFLSTAIIEVVEGYTQPHSLILGRYIR